MATITTKPKRARSEQLEARVTAEQKSLIERAAALQGRSVTDFVLSSLQEAATRAIDDHHQNLLFRRGRGSVRAGTSDAAASQRAPARDGASLSSNYRRLRFAARRLKRVDD